MLKRLPSTTIFMRKIALMEDDADLYALVKYNLEKEGFAFVGAQTGEALSTCAVVNGLI